jgi:putative transposase
MAKPRMRASDSSGELPVLAYELFSRTEVSGRTAMERMLAGLSTRCYPIGLEPVGTRVEHSARATSKSAVSRRFVTATETCILRLVTEGLCGTLQKPKAGGSLNATVSIGVCRPRVWF